MAASVQNVLLQAVIHNTTNTLKPTEDNLVLIKPLALMHRNAITPAEMSYQTNWDCFPWKPVFRR
jgi:hypothetical protein